MLQRDIGTTVKIYWYLFNFFFKSAIIADRPLWITEERFFNLLIFLQSRTGSYLSMTGSEHFSSLPCSSSWFLHICRSMDCFFPFSQMFIYLRRKHLVMRASRLPEQGNQLPVHQQYAFPVHCVPASFPVPTALPRAGCTPPGVPCWGCSCLDPWQPCTALPDSVARVWGTTEAPTPSPQPH